MTYLVHALYPHLQCFRYNVERGYGFIAVEDGGPDMYVHATGLETDGPLKDGDRVRFATVIDRRTNKPKAVDVELTGEAPAAPKPILETQDKSLGSTNYLSSLSPKADIKTSTVNPNQRALLEAKLKNDAASRANVKKVKSLQTEKIHRALLQAKLQNDQAAKSYAASQAEAAAAQAAAEAEEARLAKEAEEKRNAEEAEKARIAAEKAEEARLAKEAEEKRIAEEAEKARIAAEKEAEEARLAKEAEEKRIVEEAEKARIAAEKEAEEARLAKEAEEKRVAEETAKIEAAAAAEEAALREIAAQYGCNDVATYKVRTAHLDKDENAKLTTKYSAIPDIGERLFTILADLKMVELNLDPDDPNVLIEDDDDE